MGTPVSGKDGNVQYGGTPTDVADVINWKATLEADNKPYASSDTGGGQGVVPGIKGWGGSFEFLIDAGDLNKVDAFREGALVTVLLFFGTGTATPGKISGSVRIDTIEFDTDIEGGDLVKGTVQFTGDGAPSKTTPTDT